MATFVKRLYGDFETRSELDLKEVQLDLYARHESTRALMIGWAINDGPVTVTEGEVLPPEVLECLNDPTCQKVAWNATFDIKILLHRFGVEVNYAEWLDPMVMARYLTFPASLEHCPGALGLSTVKDTKAGRLKTKFCGPANATKKMLKAGHPPTYWRDGATDPEDWESFKGYCGSDISAMRETLKALELYPAVPPHEWNLWRLDQLINLRGIPIDMAYVDEARVILAESDQETREHLMEMTGIENLNSYQQVKDWLTGQGFPMPSIAEGVVNEVLAGLGGEVPPLVHTFLKERQKLSGAGPKKLATIVAQVSPDLRLRHQFGFYGAGTGRFIGRGVQPHNLPRPDPAIEDRIEEITDAVRLGFLLPFLDVSVAITSTVRSAFRGHRGHHLVVVDYSSIENRVLAWLSDCIPLLNVYKENRCAYRDFATKLNSIPYSEVTKEQRRVAKPAVLGAGYGMGPERLALYARSMKIMMTEEEAVVHIKAFREAYREIPALWGAVERNAFAAVRDRSKYCTGHGLVFDGRDQRYLKIDLPSARSLFYLRPRVVAVETRYGLKDRLTFEAPRSGGGPLVPEQTYGPSLVENIVQALARDILCLGLLRSHRAGYSICFHVHDEIGCEEPDGSPLDAATLAALMSAPPPWAMDMLLDAKGADSKFYQK